MNNWHLGFEMERLASQYSVSNPYTGSVLDKNRTWTYLSYRIPRCECNKCYGVKSPTVLQSPGFLMTSRSYVTPNHVKHLTIFTPFHEYENLLFLNTLVCKKCEPYL